MMRPVARALFATMFGAWLLAGIAVAAPASGWTIGGQPAAIADGRPLPPGAVAISAASYEDVLLRAQFTCATSCDFGVLVSPRKAEQGWSGIYLSIAPSGARIGKAELSAAGQVSGFEAFAPGPTIFGRTAAQANSAGPIVRPPAPVSAAPAARPPRPPVLARVGENRLELFVAGDIVSGKLNGVSLGQVLVPVREGRGYGPVIIATPGGGPAFSFVEVKDGLTRTTEAPRTEEPFVRRRASDLYYAESVTYGDFDRDGRTDVAAGPYWYKGPEFREAQEIYLTPILGPQEVSGSYISFAHDFTGDGYADIVEMAGPGSTGWLYVNPGAERRRWDRHKVTEGLSTETGVMGDVDGDGRPELAFGIDRKAGYVKPGPDPTKPWVVKIVSGEGWTMPQHGVGLGDVNGDKRLDYLTATGWWEQPAQGPDGGWIWHAQPFGSAGEASATAQMFAYDVNGDGMNDVVTALAAHGWGVAWFQQTRGADGAIGFIRHDIMTDDWPPHAGPAFSEPHAMSIADIDGDGLTDIVSGKRWFAHRDSQLDPDPLGPPVVYWFKLIRGPNGSARFEPRLIDNDSGVGVTMAVADVDGDRRPDVLTANRKGVNVFLNKPRPAR